MEGYAGFLKQRGKMEKEDRESGKERKEERKKEERWAGLEEEMEKKEKK